MVTHSTRRGIRGPLAKGILLMGFLLGPACIPFLGAEPETDMDLIRNRVISFYTGHSYIPGIAHNARTLSELENRAADLLNSGNPPGRGRNPRRYLPVRDILALAQAWAVPESRYFGDDTLHGELTSKLASVEEVIRPGSPHPGNWYNWQIALPRNLGPALILSEGKIDEALLQACIEGMDDCMPRMSLNGANAAMEARNNVYLALLRRDPELLHNAILSLQDQVVIGGGTNGLLEDYSYQFHGRLLHTMGYGSDALYSIAQVAYLCEGTRWAMPVEKKHLLARHLIEHVPWPIVGGHYDFSVHGRQVLSNFDTGQHIVAILLVAAIDPDHSRELVAVARELISRSGDSILLEESGILDPGNHMPAPLTGFRHFYTGDYSVFRQKEFYSSVRMYSERVIDYEGRATIAGGTNLTGWFLCYGLTYVSRSGNEYWLNHDIRNEDFDWERLPGTTVREGHHPAAAYNHGRSKFAGGAGGDSPQSGGTSGFILLPVTGDFQANKSYHFFEKGFVALGSGISSTAQHDEPVITTVCQWAAPETGLPLLLSGDREAAHSDGNQSWEEVTWAWHDGVGYVFLEPVTLKGHIRGRLTTLWLDHGAHPVDATYAYVVLPASSPEETAKFAAHPEIQVIRQDSIAHGLRSEQDQSEGYVFWKAGEAGPVAAESPSICHIERRFTGDVISIQNPLHTDSRIRMRIWGLEDDVLSSVPGVSTESHEDFTAIDVDSRYGRIYRIGFGVSTVKQQPRADFAPFAPLQATASVSENGQLATITIQLTDAVIQEDYRLIIRGPSGHLRAELKDSDIMERIDPNTAIYRWKRPREGPGASESSIVITVVTKLCQVVSEPLQLDRQSP